MSASARQPLSTDAGAPPAPCCPAGAEPCLITDYTPRGEMVQLEGLPVYVARPIGASSKAIVMFTDMFGVHTGRHKQMCDQFAERGFFVVCPDFFNGDTYLSHNPASGITCCCAMEMICKFLSGAWAKKTRTHAWNVSMRRKVEGILLPWMKDQGAQQFASLGFCWGAYGAMKCGANPDFRCVATYHPSVDGICNALGEDPLQICRELKCPILVVSTKQDATWKPASEPERACEAAVPGRVEFRFQEEMKHGYMMRAELKDNPAAVEAVRRGFEEFVKFAHASMA